MSLNIYFQIKIIVVVEAKHRAYVVWSCSRRRGSQIISKKSFFASRENFNYSYRQLLPETTQINLKIICIRGPRKKAQTNDDGREKGKLIYHSWWSSH